MLGAPWLVFSASARTCSLEWCSGYALRSRAPAEAENPAPSCTLEKSATPWVESRGGAPALDRGSRCCRRLSPLAGASISFLAAFPRPRSSNRTCCFPASGFQSGSCLRPRKASRPRPQAGETVVLPQPLVREAHCPPGPHLVPPTKPLTQPPDRVAVDRSVGRTDLPKAIVVRPPRHDQDDEAEAGWVAEAIRRPAVPGTAEPATAPVSPAFPTPEPAGRPHRRYALPGPRRR